MKQPQGQLLDQLLMEDIARHCPQQFLAFHQCMSKPSQDQYPCVTEQMTLVKCIRNDVPAFQKIQGECSDKLQAYDKCLRSSEMDTSKCTGELKSLRDCASDTVA